MRKEEEQKWKHVRGTYRNFGNRDFIHSRLALKSFQATAAETPSFTDLVLLFQVTSCHTTCNEVESIQNLALLTIP